MAAESDLEASEHRIHVLSSDNAGLKRKLAEYANVVRRARSFADEASTQQFAVHHCKYLPRHLTHEFVHEKRDELERT